MILRSLTLCAIVCFAAAGCRTVPDPAPSAGLGDPYPAPLNDPQITVLSPELRRWLAFQPAIVTKDGERPMEVEVPLRNLTYDKYLIEYRFLFYDENNREINPVMGWQFQPLEPKQLVRLKSSAMSNDADNYRLEVKWSR
jgi:uncharacterized protein YcfL